MRAIIFLAIIGAAMAVPDKITRIIGGTPTSVEQYPYMSSMEYGLWGIWWFQSCGGSLITSRSVLSAAHCYQGDRPSDWRVRVGSSLASSGGTVLTVLELVLHPGYSRATLDNDVAIVRLASPAPLSATVGVARIPGPYYQLNDGEDVYAIGWGATAVNGPSSEQLLHARVNVINQELCAERYAYLKTLPNFQNWPDITDGMLCAGILDVGGKDACQGDSGGPLAHYGDIVVGITSWGFECADPFYPGVNARVSKYSDWIAATA